MHPCEPKLEELKEIRKALFASESTNDNMKKIKAIEAQIERREKESAKESKQ